MSWFMVDVEADGPCPGLFSMIELGCVVVAPGLKRTFHAKLQPLHGARSDAEALKVTGYTRAELLTFPPAWQAMEDFRAFVKRANTGGTPRFISDNNGFDWQFVNYYFWITCGANPFGHSSTNLGSLYKGLVKSMKPNFKHLRKTKHKHNPVDGARGNAEALLHMRDMLGLEITL